MVFDRAKVRFDLPSIYLLSVALVLLICSSAAALRIPLSDVVYPLYFLLVTFLLLFALILTWCFLKQEFTLSLYHLFVLLLILIGCLIILWPYLGGGIWDSLGTKHPDGWNHIARGQYLWHNARGADGGLPAIDQYSAHQANTRWGSSSMLAFLSPLRTAGDPSSVVILFFALTLIGIYASNLVLASTLGLRGMAAHGLGFFSLSFGWIESIIQAGNYENLLFLVFGPAFAASLLKLSRDSISWFDVIFSSVVLAAALQNYIEGSVLLLFLVTPLYLFPIVPGRRLWTAIALRYGAAVIITLILVSPILPYTIEFLQSQIHAFSRGGGLSRPGEGLFPGLLSTAFLPALFSFGEELPGAKMGIVSLLLASIISLMLLWGIKVLARVSCSFSLIGIPFVILILWQGIYEKYDYGLYKVINISSWWWVTCIYFGIYATCSKLFKKKGIIVLYVIILLIPIMLFVERKEDKKVIESVSRDKYVDLRKLTKILKNRPVVNMTTNATDYIWSVYFLREAKLVLPYYLSYIGQKHVLRFMNGASRPKSVEDALYLYSTPQAENVWTNKHFYLSARETSIIIKMQNPNGIENMGNVPFIWIGNEPAVFTIMAPSAGTYYLRAQKMTAGPSIPNTTIRNIRIVDSAGDRVVIFDGKRNYFKLLLKKGVNRVSIRGVDARTVAVLPNGDRRSLLLGIQGYTVSGR